MNMMPPETIPALFLDSVTTHNKKNAFLYKSQGRWAGMSHEALLDTVANTCRGIISSHLVKGDRIALLSENRIEWVVADLAILSAGCVTVPVHTPLSSAQIEFILNDIEARAVFVSNREQYDKIRPIRSRIPSLLRIFSFDPIPDESDVETLESLIERGTASQDETSFEERIATIDKNEWASIIYTSGTTGTPKGAVLTHRNFVANAKSCAAAIAVGPEDRALSLLPLSHVLERTAGYYCMLSRGATIAFGDGFDNVREDLLGVRPTIVISVPRFFEKLYAKTLDAVTAGPVVKKNLFFWAVDVGRVFVKQSLENRLNPLTKFRRSIADRIVFRTLKKQLGGRVRFFVSGGASLGRDIAEFFHAVGLPVHEGYGTTETAPVVAVNTFDHFKFGTVGKPLRDVDVKIAEDGEILVKGPNVMHGYYKRPDLTEDVVREGWYHTGDIGHLDDDGFLTITDRKNDLIVTSGGKNVAPQQIENLLKTSKYVTQAVLIGNNRKFVSALIVPNFENLTVFADMAGVPYGDRSDLVRNPKVIAKMTDEIERKSEYLAGYERVKKFVLLDKDFSVEDNELTLTLKVKRRIIENKFKGEIDALYTE
jgi:long-chain acyl-CoA synthetase